MGGVVSSTSRMRVLASFLLASSVVYTVRCLSEDELLLLSPEELCKDRLSEEYFRLKADYDGGDCRDVVRCDRAGAAGTIRLAAVRCPAGLAFDIYRQTCDWKAKVDNCDQLSKPNKALFCDEQVDCQDGSDENACDVDQDPNRAPECDTATCQLPDCFCSPDGTRIPGNINPDQVPQMITITFNGAINSDNIDLYQEIFNGERQNPNSCQIKGTFFVSHRYTNYSAVQELHGKGHEIGVFSITNKDSPNYWSEGSYDDWLAEMAGARPITERFANITDGSVIGVRAPFLRVGGNKQFEMMADQFFVYELDRRDDPTFDEALPGCHLVSSCSNIFDPDQFARMLRYNFQRHFGTNRAPLGLHFNAEWIKKHKGFKRELIKFINEMLGRNDVYFVTMLQVIQWMQNPTEMTALRDFTEWKDKCDVKGQPYCSLPNPCPLGTRELPGFTHRLHTCMECPNNYPWILDPTGDGFSFK